MGIPEQFGKDASEFLQDPVALFMSHRVVDLLEIIEIDHHDRHRLAKAGLKVLAQGHAIAETRQSIGDGHVLQFSVFAVKLLGEPVHGSERPDFFPLQKADKNHIRGDPDQGYGNLLGVFGSEACKAMICGEKVQRISQHDQGGDDSSPEAKQGGTEYQACDQYHVGIGNIEKKDQKNQKKHDSGAEQQFFRKAHFRCHPGSLSGLFIHGTYS